MLYGLPGKSKRSLEFHYKYYSNLLKQRLRGTSDRTIRILKVSAGNAQQSNECQFDPLWVESRLLCERLGVIVRPLRIDQALRLSPRVLGRFDILLLQFFFRTPVEDVERTIDILKSRSSPQAKIVYFDGDDDLGILWPQILKRVDLYVKNQLLVDRAAYLRPTIGKSNLTEYVAVHHGVSFDSDPFPRSTPVADVADLNKIFLGWNLGTSRIIYKVLKKTKAEPARRKDIAVACRVTFPHGGFIEPLRVAAIRHLEALAGEYRVVATTDRIRPAEFRDELRRSRICVSPFGHGEVCFRDFEAVLNGCLLIKPDMGHLETRPNIYVPGQTYVPVRWDFCDLAEKCRYYLENESERARIADSGNRALRKFYETHAFTDIFAQLLARLGLPDRPMHDARESAMTDG
jgi:Glycosyl transferases group 1